MSTITRWLKVTWRWIGPLDWYLAWFGGSAVTAFQLHHPGLGWFWAAICAVIMTGKVAWQLWGPAKRKAHQ
jgi:hypothetical protein